MSSTSWGGWNESESDYGDGYGSYTSGSYYYGGNWSAGSAGTASVNFSLALEPLIRQLRQYDEARTDLEANGGTLASLGKITEHLKQVVAIKSQRGSVAVRLVDQSSIRRMLQDVTAGRVHLQVRQLDSGMPVYYLCRTMLDYWSTYSVIVEDLYISPEYPMDDDRFVCLMRAGRETYHLRLAPYRADMAALLSGASAGSSAAVGDGAGAGAAVGADGVAGEEAPGESIAASPWQVDSALHRVGRHVFQAAWHEDQRAAILVARSLNLPRLREAVELLYLVLSGELCELRGAMDETTLAFFEDVYPQPAIASLLRRLDGLEGGAMTELPRTALEAYSRLLSAFGRFLRTKVTWEAAGGPIPLYKLVYANFGRLDNVARVLAGEESVEVERERLEAVARRLTAEIVGEAAT